MYVRVHACMFICIHVCMYLFLFIVSCFSFLFPLPTCTCHLFFFFFSFLFHFSFSLRLAFLFVSEPLSDDTPFAVLPHLPRFWQLTVLLPPGATAYFVFDLWGVPLLSATHPIVVSLPRLLDHGWGSPEFRCIVQAGCC